MEKIKMEKQSSDKKVARFIKLQYHNWVHDIVKKIEKEIRENEIRKGKIKELEKMIRSITGELNTELREQQKELRSQEIKYEVNAYDSDSDDDFYERDRKRKLRFSLYL